MKVVGIVAEYNPFHNGHKYQIEELRKRTDADYVVIAMSGNFLQRGVPAVCDKYSRTRMALSCGADLVLELPPLWATASAEYFAEGAVNLLKNTGVVTHLGFGAETDNLDALSLYASIMKKEPPLYQETLAAALKEGRAFPVARKKALMMQSIQMNHAYNADTLNEIMDAPNNILAMEYLKALPKKGITPVLVKREGAGYHSTDIHEKNPSATAIRSAMQANNTKAYLKKSMPEEAFTVMRQCIEKNALLESNNLSSVLGFRLLSLQKEGYADFADCNEDLSNKILNHLNEFTCFDAFCQELKTKDLTHTRVSRVLLHILLNIREKDYTAGKQLKYAPYLRVLGFRKDSTALLSEIKKEASVPLITKVADAASNLPPKAYKMFEQDLYASSIYNQVMTVRKHQPPANDYTSQIVIL